MSIFSKNLRLLRKLKGITQAELAKAIGVSQGTIFFWENAENSPNTDYLLAIAKIFDISTEIFLTEDIASIESRERVKDQAVIVSKLNETDLKIPEYVQILDERDARFRHVKVAPIRTELYRDKRPFLIEEKESTSDVNDDMINALKWLSVMSPKRRKAVITLLEALADKDFS